MTVRGGSILLPRRVADNVGQLNWPKCAACARQCDAYGIENETPSMIEIWARCNGVTHGHRVHELKRDSVVIMKGIGWSPNRFTEIIRRLAFFHPLGDRRWTQEAPNPNSVIPRGTG